MRAEAALWSLAVFVPANACVRAQGREHGAMNVSIGAFYEGCIVDGCPSNAKEDALRANVAAAG